MREDRQRLAARNRRVIGGIENAVFLEREKSVVPRDYKIAEESVRRDVLLIQIEAAQQLRRVIADVAQLHNRAFELVLDGQGELLIVGLLQLGIDQRVIHAGVELILRGEEVGTWKGGTAIGGGWLTVPLRSKFAGKAWSPGLVAVNPSVTSTIWSST